MACVFLDPRVKFSAKRIAAVGNIPRKEEKAIHKNAMDYVRDEHRKVFAQMTMQGEVPLSQVSSSQSSLRNQESTSPFSSPSSTGWDGEDELLLGAPIRASKSRDEVKEPEINARADTAMKAWIELEPEWLEIVELQSPDNKKEDLSKETMTDAHNGMHWQMYWGLLGLYKHVDVLKWLRDEGETQFPTITLLARIHLGKISSSPFQERVFTTGGIAMGPLRNRTDSR
ncbi:hypothetical protein PI124_g18169 [Phytophthora idaei]|nr:hypothetical protein PI125_g18885 [Phytophthora idaei]KAG3137076.1 hypothetical protein PI126_g17545 [Phytophthora idaei]KAG3236826.1 hypothetical protein PI124_g18169 [Phytophthora idaei]